MSRPEYAFNPLVEGIEPSTIRALNALKKKSSIDLGLGEPTLGVNLRYFEAATRWVGKNGCHYTPNAGDSELRELIARHYAYPKLDRLENVIVTAGGSQEAVYLAIKALLDPSKDELLIVEPAFPVYAKCAQMEGVRTRAVGMDPASGYAFDAERIFAALEPQTRMIAICSPCNPTARVMAREQVERLAQLLIARGGKPVYVLHDEVYRELAFVPDAGWFGEVYPHTIVVNSLSKSNALTGLRIGWITAPKSVAPIVARAHAYVASTASTYAQRVAIEIFGAADGLREQHGWYAEQRVAVLDELTALRLRFLPIEGTFFAAVHVGDQVDTLEFAHRLVERDDVVAIPGSIFGACFEGWLRCSWVAPLDRLREGFSRISTALVV